MSGNFDVASPGKKSIRKSDGATKAGKTKHQTSSPNGQHAQNGEYQSMDRKLSSEIDALEKEIQQLETERQEQASTKPKGESDKSRLEFQKKHLKGNELLKVERLLHMGFDEKVITAHLKKQNKTLEKSLKQRGKDNANMKINIGKMKEMNSKCEQALITAEAVHNAMSLEQTNLRKTLDAADLKLYGIESKATHKKGMVGVDFTSKDTAKGVLKDVVRLVKTRCDDDDIVKTVFKIAGKSLVASDMNISMHLSGTNFNLSRTNFNHSGTSFNLSGTGLNWSQNGFGSTHLDDSSVSISSDSSVD